MQTPLEHLASLDIPVVSPSAAIQYLNGRPEYKQSQYEAIIKDVTEVDFKATNANEARFTFLYLVQNVIQADVNLPDLSVMLKESHQQALKFIKNNKWVFARPEETVRYDEEGNVKRKKGDKRLMAEELYQQHHETKSRKELIELFIEEIGMSKAGATTYFYNCRNKFSAE